MILSHKIALDPTVKQSEHFCRACGVSRFAWNWALEEWNRQHAAGEKPSLKKILRQWNAIRREQFPWTYEVTKWSSVKSIMDLDLAFRHFFRNKNRPQKQRKFGYPKFKKKGSRDSFYVASGSFAVDGKRIRIPILGWVRMREELRLPGHMTSVTICREGCRWFASISVDTEVSATHLRPGTVVGVDMGIAKTMVLSQPCTDGTSEFVNPRIFKRFDKRIRKLQRRISRQEKRRAALGAAKSNRHKKRQEKYRKMHYRAQCIRSDLIHKATTKIARSFETVSVENLCVMGMTKNHRIANAVIDVAFYTRRKQLEYKTRKYGGKLIVVDRWFPSSKTCSECGHLLDKLGLEVREWVCPECGAIHDRDINAAKNLENVGRASPKLPLVAATLGETAALANSSELVKLQSQNREPDDLPCAEKLDGGNKRWLCAA